MILEAQITQIMERTGSNDTNSIITELNSAQDDIWNQIIVMNENILKVDNCQLTMAALTSSYDLGASVTTGTLVAIKWLGVKFAADTVFNPVIWIDSSTDAFILADQSIQAATTSPVYATSENFTRVRFAPPLPAGTIIRADYIYMPVEMNLSTKIVSDLPKIVHQAMTDIATAQTFTNIDDLDRYKVWAFTGQRKVAAAMNSLRKRQYQQTPQTRSSRVGSGPYSNRGPNP